MQILNNKYNWKPKEKIRTIAINYRCSRLQNRTESELKFRALLKSIGYLKFMEEEVFFYTKSRFLIADFYIPNPYNIVIEIDGGYHLKSKTIDYCIKKEWYLRENGIKVIRIPNREVESLTYFDILKMIGIPLISSNKSTKRQEKSKIREKDKIGVEILKYGKIDLNQLDNEFNCIIW